MYELTELEAVTAKVNLKLPLAMDTETVGKYGKIRLVQFFQRGWKKVKIVENPDPIKLLHQLTIMKDVTLVMQYSPYDISTIQQQTSTRWIPYNFDDTFLLGRLAYPELDSYTLDSLYERALGKDVYSEVYVGGGKAEKKRMQKSDWKAASLTFSQFTYAATDVYYLLDLYDAVKHKKPSLLYRLDKLSVRYACDFQNNILKVDMARLDYQEGLNNDRLKELNTPINVNSYKQVREYLGTEESDDLGLIRLAQEGGNKAHEAKNVREARKLIKENSFITKYRKAAEVDGGIRGRFAPSARSGRFTCSDNNLQQIPRNLKRCFGVGKDAVLVYADFSQYELRCAAAITADTELCNLLRTGADVHGYTAEQTFGSGYTSEQRQIAKTENFNLLYGGGAEMLQSIVLKETGKLLDIEEVKELIKKWRTLFRGITQWHEGHLRDHENGRPGRTPFGREYTSKRFTDHISIQNQGLAAEISKLALHYIVTKDGLLKYRGKLVNFVHDSFLVEMPGSGDYQECCKHIADSMIKAWKKGCQAKTIRDNTIPMPVDVSVGRNWGEIEKGYFIYRHSVDVSGKVKREAMDEGDNNG